MSFFAFGYSRLDTAFLQGNVCNENHVIDWASAKVIDRESDKAGRLIREAIWIRKTDNMNRDEGSYQLSHMGQAFTY